MSSRLAWVALLYFAEGLPFAVFIEALPVYLRLQGVSLADIGALTLLSLPWSLKVLWAPIIDRLGSPRLWITGALLAVTAALALLPLVGVAPPGLAFLGCLALLTMASATQDVAIDGAFVRLLPEREIGVGNGVRVTAYRVALIVGGGVSIMLVDLLTRSGLPATEAWNAGFLGLAAVALLLAVSLWRAPIATQPATEPTADWLRSLWQWFWRPGALPVFAFVLLYKLGDAAMGPMVKPFWVDRGMSLTDIGAVSTGVGIAASIAGAIAGGWYVSKRGVFTGLWVLGLTQAASNLVYAGIAATDLGRPGLYAASLCESFTGGLGTAALMSFNTSLCDRKHAATQYALLSAIFGFTRTVAGSLSGVGAESLGYAGFFLLTVALSLPAYVLLPYVKRWLPTSAPSVSPSLATAS